MRSYVALPSTDRLPSTVSAADVTRLCSRFPRYYAVVRLLMPSSRASLHRASPTGPGPRVAAAGDMRPPRFRTKDVSTCMGSPTARGPSHTRHLSHEMMLPSPHQKKMSTSEMPVSQLNTQPMVSPVNASRQTSRSAAHHSGPKRLAKPYSAGDLHLLSFASLSWRSPILATNSRADRLSVMSGLAPKPTFPRHASAFAFAANRPDSLRPR